MTKNRCFICKKKTLVGIKCECGIYLCLLHRYKEFHHCENTDKRIEEEKNKLKNNLLCNKSQSNKMEKI